MVKVKIDNIEVEGWKSFSITRSLDDLCGTFELTFIDSTPAEVLLTGKLVEIFEENDQLLKGYIYSRSRAFNSKIILISGRDVTGDLVDCSADVKSWYNVPLSTIVGDIIQPFNILSEISSSAAAENISKFTIQSGETGYDALERLCKIKGILANTTRDGKVWIHDVIPDQTEIMSSPLEKGVNLKELEETLQNQDVFSLYKMRGHNKFLDSQPWTRQSLQAGVVITDENVDRYRPTTIINDGSGGTSDLTKRGKWEAQNRASKSLVYKAKTSRFRTRTSITEFDGNLWELGKLVRLKNDNWNLDIQRIISSITYSLSEKNGSETSFVLKDPKSYELPPANRTSIVSFI